jgi:hypothetical protein
MLLISMASSWTDLWGGEAAQEKTSRMNEFIGMIMTKITTIHIILTLPSVYTYTQLDHHH